MKRLLTALEWGFHEAMLLLIMGAFIPLWHEVSGNPMDPAKGDPFIRALLLLGYGIALLMLLKRPRAVVCAVLRSPLLWTLLLWALVSAAWSVAPEVTLRRSLAAVLTALYALLIAMRFTFQSFLRLLGWTLFVALSVSLFFVFVFPEWGVMGYPHEGAWRGIFVHKNTLGRYAALAVLVFGTLVLISTRKRQKVLWLTGLGVALMVLFGSRSAASLVLAATVVLVGGTLWLGSGLRRLWPIVFPAFILVASAAGLVLVNNYELLLEALGKGPTLTGRVPLWQTLWSFILERPWFGYGNGGFWLGLEGPSVYVWKLVGWSVPHAHNGYLDLWLQLGVVGLVLGILLLIQVLSTAIWQYLKRPLSREAMFWVTLSIFLIVLNLPESNFLRANNLFWLLLSLASIALGNSHSVCVGAGVNSLSSGA